MPKDFEIKRKVLIKYNGKSKNPVIPEGVEKIGKSAFEVAEIDSVTIPKSLKYVGAGAFADCHNLGVRTISKLEGKGEDIYAEDAWD